MTALKIGFKNHEGIEIRILLKNKKKQGLFREKVVV